MFHSQQIIIVREPQKRAKKIFVVQEEDFPLIKILRRNSKNKAKKILAFTKINNTGHKKKMAKAQLDNS